MKKKLLTFAAFFLLIFPVFPKSVFAAEKEFSTSYDVAYEVGTDGSTQVTEKINIKNLTDQYYPSNFSLTVGSTTLSDISASDSSGAMEVKVDKGANYTSMSLKFNTQVVGLDKSQDFTLKYKSTDFAQSIGKTWEVNLPKIPDSSNIRDYNLTLSVPTNFGDPTSVSPSPKSQSQRYDRYVFIFNKGRLEKNGVSINFGNNQVFSFGIKYNLDNTSLFPAITSITLPPDTQYQDIAIKTISPEPENVTIDGDGNYLAWYRLNRRTNQTITVSGLAKLYIKPKDGKIPQLSSAQRDTLLKADKYWEKDNPQIKATLAVIFKDGTPTTTRDKAKLVYDYVVKSLKYNTSRLNNNNIERLGAITALNNPNESVCMEFTDLFIALMRAEGIPARELDGYAYSLNKSLRPLSLSRDLLHAWPEYYDEKLGWIMVDPTWENTSGGVDYFNKFDLNHLVLAKKGVSSTTPYISDQVQVAISDEKFVSDPDLTIDIDTPQILWAGLPYTITVKAKNNGTGKYLPQTLSLNTNNIGILGSNTVDLEVIPPHGSATSLFQSRTAFNFNSFNDQIVVTVGGQKFYKNVTVKPIIYFAPLPYILIGVGVFVGGLYFTILSLHLFKKPHKNPA